MPPPQKKCGGICFFALMHIYRRHLSPPVQKKYAQFPIFGLYVKYYHLFKQKVLNAHNRKKYTLLNLILVNIWNLGKKLKGLHGQNHCRNVGPV